MAWNRKRNKIEALSGDVAYATRRWHETENAYERQFAAARKAERELDALKEHVRGFMQPEKTDSETKSEIKARHLAWIAKMCDALPVGGEYEWRQ